MILSGLAPGLSHLLIANIIGTPAACVSSYVRDELTAKVVGATRPMIKINDIRALEVPQLNMKDMQDIGKAFVFSGLKKATLQKMIDNETELMENVVLASIKEGICNEE